jgi:hypothetical protein
MYKMRLCDYVFFHKWKYVYIVQLGLDKDSIIGNHMLLIVIILQIKLTFKIKYTVIVRIL